ncbi:hypothetical protein RYX45_23250, partial [Alkalihalophilus pseudofirmus]
QPEVDGYFPIALMSEDDFNKLTSNHKLLKDMEYIYYINEDPEYAGDMYDVQQELLFTLGEEERSYKLKEAIAVKSINNLRYFHEFI